MDVRAASEAVAGMIAGAAAAEPPTARRADETAGIAGRVRSVFGADARSVDALERAEREDRTPADVAELASALAWYAKRDTEFTGELAAGRPRAMRAALRRTSAPDGTLTCLDGIRGLSTNAARASE